MAHVDAEKEHGEEMNQTMCDKGKMTGNMTARQTSKKKINRDVAMLIERISTDTVMHSPKASRVFYNVHLGKYFMTKYEH